MPELADRMQIARASQGTGQGRTVLDLIKVQESEIRKALPRAMNAERFTRIVLTECKRNKNLLACTPESFLGALMQAAQLGIEPGPLGEAYLVPYNRDVQLIVGYRGLLSLARRSGQITTIVAREVGANDDFRFEYGSEESLRHVPRLNDRGAIVAYYAIVKFKDGGQQIHVMDLDDIKARRGRSKSASSGPWKTDFDAMARKTVIRAMAPYLPLSPEFAQALEVDENVTFFRPSDTEPLDVREVTGEDAEVGDAAPEGDRTGETASTPSVDDDPSTSGEADGPANTAQEPAPVPDGGEDSPPSTLDWTQGSDPAALGLETPLEALTRDQLQAICEVAGLEVSGTKPALIARIREADGQ